MADDGDPGATLPQTPPADDGAPDPWLLAALVEGARAEVLAALVDARVFAGIAAAATAEEVTQHGLRAESSAEMAVLLLESGGETALPVFSSVRALRRWRVDARPVPLTGPQACRAALDEGAAALVIDAGGSSVTLPTADLQAVAGGWVPVVGAALASRRGETALTEPDAAPPAGLLTALAGALAPESLRAARLLQGPDGFVLGVAARRRLGPADLAALAHRVMTRLGDALPPDGLDLAQVAPRGPGVPVLRRSRWRRRP